MGKRAKTYVYGIYDSRGGTYAIRARSKAEADKEFGHVLCNTSRSVIREFYLGACYLEGADDPHMPLSTDLEWVADGAVFVVGPGKNGLLPTKKSINGATLRFERNPTYDIGNNVNIPKGHHHPRWDDDACSFWFVDLLRVKKSDR